MDIQSVQIPIISSGAGENWWDPNGEGLCIWAAYQPKGAADFAASLVDLSGNGNNAGDPGGAATPPWDNVNGWKPDGVGDYLTTLFIPANDQSQSMLVQFTNATNVGIFLGQRTVGPPATQTHIYRGVIEDQINYSNAGTGIGVAPVMAAGNLGIAGNSGYRNGVAEGAALPVRATPPAHALYIAARNNGGVIQFPMAVYIQALAIYDCTLTAPQMAAVAAAMAAE